jgi:hypothetical protein
MEWYPWLVPAVAAMRNWLGESQAQDPVSGLVYLLSMDVVADPHLGFHLSPSRLRITSSSDSPNSCSAMPPSSSACALKILVHPTRPGICAE